jgi:hypothetical protein
VVLPHSPVGRNVYLGIAADPGDIQPDRVKRFEILPKVWDILKIDSQDGVPFSVNLVHQH